MVISLLIQDQFLILSFDFFPFFNKNIFYCYDLR
nr:MAG TPA: hypothetical protein [Bacteriophage sp.]